MTLPVASTGGGTPSPAGAPAEALKRAHRLIAAGEYRKALDLVTRLLPTLGPFDRAVALIMRAALLLNFGDIGRASAMDEAFAAVQARPEPYLHGHLHVWAARESHRRGALEQAATHLVHSQRYLAVADPPHELTVCAWHDLAGAYSEAGFHGYAISALEKAQELARKVGMPGETFATPSIRVRVATWHDHLGDTDACVRVLDDVMSELKSHITSGRIDRVRPAERAWYGYALSRLTALGHPSDVDIRPLFADVGDQKRNQAVVELGEICQAIGEGRPKEAVSRLDAGAPGADLLGAAELLRVRALAHLRSGDHRAAYEADRAMFRTASALGEQLREVFVEGIAARLAHEGLRRTVARYVDEALTDPLTGLPNRRHLERYVSAMVERGEQAVIGVCDMDGFKAVNTIHGHLAGDQVLRRVGEIILRVMRRGDFVARYGGDEFVVVLPHTALAEAEEVAQRIVNAVGTADWSALVPGTPVGVSVGWAEVAGPRMELRQALVEAFDAADRAMLHAKNRARARAS